MIEQIIKNVLNAMTSRLDRMQKFFEENQSYSDEKLAKYLNVDLGVTERLLKEYADYELGLKIAESVRTTGQCEFTAEF